MSKSKVKVNDLGMTAVLKELSRVAGLHVVVGVTADHGSRTDGTDMILVASVNEFGTADGRVPQRSYIRSTIDERRLDIAKVHEKVFRKVVDGKLTVREALDIIGTWVKNAVKKKITDLKEPPNAPATIAKKGSSNPLLDTNQLRAAVTHVVVAGRAPRGQV